MGDKFQNAIKRAITRQVLEYVKGPDGVFEERADGSHSLRIKKRIVIRAEDILADVEKAERREQAQALVKRASKRTTLPVSAKPRYKPGVVPHIASKFEHFKPGYYTVAGEQYCTLGWIDVSKETGETVAYYHLKVRNPLTGVMENTLYLYGYRDGQFYEIKRFPKRYSNG